MKQTLYKIKRKKVNLIIKEGMFPILTNLLQVQLQSSVIFDKNNKHFVKIK